MCRHATNHLAEPLVRSVAFPTSCPHVGKADVVCSDTARIHPSRYRFGLEVERSWWHRDIGKRLVGEALQARTKPSPLASKVRTDDLAAVGLLRHLGGQVYQRCNGERLRLERLRDQRLGREVDGFVNVYCWAHVRRYFLRAGGERRPHLR